VMEPSGLYYPNRIARAFFLAMDDVMGRNGLSNLLQLSGLEVFDKEMPPNDLERSFDFAYLAAMSQGLEEMYGKNGGRGMALRIGRASFAQGLKGFGVLRGISDPAFRALPLPSRTEIGLKALANVLTNFTDQASRVEIEDKSYVFYSELCPFAWGRTSDKPVCNTMVGLLQECLSWASNGYEFYVREVACRACGNEECVFRINKTPIGERK
jgi:predicted hydrocarbon binding protein